MKYVYKKRMYKAIVCIIDSVGFFLAGIFKIFSGKPVFGTGKILIIRVDHIGDVVMATSVIAPLRRAFPSAKIDFIAPSWARELLSQDPHINNVTIFDAPWFLRCKAGFINGVKGFFAMTKMIRRGGYDLVIDLRGDARHIAAAFLSGAKTRISYGITGLGFLLTEEVPYDEKCHEIDKNLALLGPLGVSCVNASSKLYFSKENALAAENIKKKMRIDNPYVVLHVTAGRPEKNWTSDGFSGLVDYIGVKKGLMPVIIGGNEDTVYIKGVMEKTSQKVIDLSGKFKISELTAFLEGASLFVGLDSGPSHIAAAVGVPSVILFSGANDPLQWAPRGGNVRVVCPGKGKGLDEVGLGEVVGVIDKV